MKDVKVSIVMPTYNVEKYISAAIESVLSQTFRDWELLIVDDGATDASVSIAEMFAQRDNRIKILQKTNGGLSDARNFGLMACKGEFVHFFDSDDAIEPDFYDVMIKTIEDNRDDFVICGYYKDFETKDGIIAKEMRCESIESSNLTQNNSFRDLFVSYFNYAWNKVFRVEFLKQHNLEYKKGLSIIEDKEFMSRVILHKPKFRFIEYLGYHYKVRDQLTLNNRVTDDFVKRNAQGIVLQKEIISFFCKNHDLVKADSGIIAYDGIRWTIYCIFNNSKEPFAKKKKLVESMLNMKDIQHQLSLYKAEKFKDATMKYLLNKKYVFCVCLIYRLLK